MVTAKQLFIFSKGIFVKKQPILSIHSIKTRRSSSFCLAVDSLELYAGTKLCITGPNGSGKSTLLEHIVGLLPYQSGEIRVCGLVVEQNMYATRSNIGFIPDDENWFVGELCAREYFALLQSIYAKAGRTVSDAYITTLANTVLFSAFSIPLRQLSHGNKKKVQIIAALMHKPPLIVIDELRNGLDPLAIIQAESLLQKEASRGACIVAASHDLWWTERIADEVLFLRNGSVLLHKTKQAILATYGSVEDAFLKKLGGSA